jgi:hypothetical protein
MFTRSLEKIDAEMGTQFSSHDGMMEAAGTSVTSVIFYRVTRRTNPEIIHHHTHRHENLKSHMIV